MKKFFVVTNSEGERIGGKHLTYGKALDYAQQIAPAYGKLYLMSTHSGIQAVNVIAANSKKLKTGIKVTPLALYA